MKKHLPVKSGALRIMYPMQRTMTGAPYKNNDTKHTSLIPHHQRVSAPTKVTFPSKKTRELSELSDEVEEVDEEDSIHEEGEEVLLEGESGSESEKQSVGFRLVK